MVTFQQQSAQPDPLIIIHRFRPDFDLKKHAGVIDSTIRLESRMGSR